ncbi:MAG TPA: hypothetical protein VK711_14570 [Puia sp.]|jgi:hypothetical protein|nr:hypothetical protein [Puia sp.]
MKLFIISFILFMCLSCSKTNTQNNNVPPQNDLKTQLSGNWKVVKYVAYNFDSTNGRPYIPNDTIYPVNSESWNFSEDSVYIDSWETFTYSATTHPYSFTNSQTKEFIGTYPYIAGQNYFNVNSGTYVDSNYVISVTASELIVRENTYINLTDPSSGVLYNLNIYLQR